jgi:hypothetical protein
MQKVAFFKSLENNIPPDEPLLKALWLDFNGQWNEAHHLVDSMESKDAARIHAYLHRKEGDAWNAGYWYRRAGQEVMDCSLDEEWKILVNHFCSKNE